MSDHSRAIARDWKARAEKAEATMARETALQQAGLAAAIDRYIRAEAALREVQNLCAELPPDSGLRFKVFDIVRAALEGK